MRPEKKLNGGGKQLQGRVRRNMGSGGGGGGGFRGDIGSEGT